MLYTLQIFIMKTKFVTFILSNKNKNLYIKQQQQINIIINII